jgi:hypothetical protein
VDLAKTCPLQRNIVRVEMLRLSMSLSAKSDQIPIISIGMLARYDSHYHEYTWFMQGEKHNRYLTDEASYASSDYSIVASPPTGYAHTVAPRRPVAWSFLFTRF